MPGTANSTKTKSQDSNGLVRLSSAGFPKYFDSRARTLVRLSGSKALKRIRSGKAGSNLAWTELRLLSTLFRDK
jgi:hypothetical protein